MEVPKDQWPPEPIRLTSSAIDDRGARAILANPRLQIGLLVVLAAVYVLNITPYWYVGKDSGLYLMLARSIATGQGYSLCGVPNTHVPPGFPLMLAGLMKLGLGSFLAMNIVMGVIALAVIGMTYLLCRCFVHRDWALLITALTAFSRELVQRGGEMLADSPFMLVLLAGLWFAHLARDRKSLQYQALVASVVLLTVSCWFRLPGLPLVVGVAMGWVLTYWRQSKPRAAVFSLVTLAGVVVTVGALLYFYRTHADPTAATYDKQIAGLRDWGAMAGHLVENFLYALGQYFRLLTGQRPPVWIAAIVVGVPTVAGMLYRAKRRDYLIVFAVAGYVGGLLVGSVWLRTRYLMPVLPFLLLFLIEGYLWIIAALGRRFSSVRARQVKVAYVVVITLTVVLLGMNLPLVGRLVVCKHRSDYPVVQQRGRWRDLPSLAAFLAERSDHGGVVGRYAVGYLAGRPTPSISTSLQAATPTDEQMTQLLQRWEIGDVVFDDEDDLTPFMRQLQDYLARRGGDVVYQGDSVMVVEVPQDDWPGGRR